MELETGKPQPLFVNPERIHHLMPADLAWPERTAWLERRTFLKGRPVRWVTDNTGKLKQQPTVLPVRSAQASLAQELIHAGPLPHGKPSGLFSSCSWAKELTTAPRTIFEEDREWVRSLQFKVPRQTLATFCEAVATWQRESQGVRRRAMELLAGVRPMEDPKYLTKETMSLLSVLRAMPPTAPKLYRGISLEQISGKREKNLFAVGDTLHLTPQSFSERRHVAQGFGRWFVESLAYPLSILLQCAPGSRSLCVAPFSTTWRCWDEAEWIVAGTFQVTGVERPFRNRMIVSLEPTAGVDALACGPEESHS